MGRIRVGVSGWTYDGWEGGFYPDDLPKKQQLAYAAERFTTLEINGTFYSLKRPEHFRRWHAETPRGFRFAVKGGRFITHVKRLKDVRTPLANFFASGVLELREKLGPILWQLPPNFRYDRDRLAAFLDLLPRDTAAASALARRHDERVTGRASMAIDRNRRLQHAVEVRHESFLVDEWITQLHAQRIGSVASHTNGRWPYLEDVTAGFVYVRLHGPGTLYASGYRSLDRWASRLRRWHEGRQPDDARTVSDRRPPRRQSRDVWIYFDNTDKEHAPRDAVRLMQHLERA